MKHLLTFVLAIIFFGSTFAQKKADLLFKSDSLSPRTGFMISGFDSSENFTVWDNDSIVASKRMGKWEIKNPERAIEILFKSYNQVDSLYNGWQRKYWAFVRYTKTLLPALQGDKKAIKEHAKAEKEFTKLQKQFP